MQTRTEPTDDRGSFFCNCGEWTSSLHLSFSFLSLPLEVDPLLKSS